MHAQPWVGTSLVYAFNGKVQVGLLVLGNLVTLRAVDPFSPYSMLEWVSLKNPLEAWDACAAP